MDFCCVTLKPNTHLTKVSKGGLSNGENGFLGDRIRGSLNNSVWVKQLEKTLRTEKKVKRVKPGVAFAVFTSNNTDVAVPLVSLHSLRDLYEIP